MNFNTDIPFALVTWPFMRQLIYALNLEWNRKCHINICGVKNLFYYFLNFRIISQNCNCLGSANSFIEKTSQIIEHKDKTSIKYAINN